MPKTSDDLADELAWRALLAQLLRDHPALVDDFLTRLDETGTYRSVEVPPDDLRRAASDTLELLIRRLAGLPVTPSLEAVPAALGVRRARQGVARESLMDAVRLDFRVLWAGLVRAGGDGSADLLVTHAEAVLTTVERYIGDVQTAFLDEQAALARDSHVAVVRALARLLSARDDLHEVAGGISDVLGLALEGTFEVVHVPPTTAEKARRITSAVYRDGEYLSADLDDGTLFVRPHDVGSGLSVVLASVTGGLVRRVEGVVALPAGIGLARRISRHALPTRLSEERDVWLAIVHERVVDALPSLATTPEGLAGLDDEDRRRLIDTVVHFCCTGSIKQTASELYCHRNTVVNRLRQFRELTGCDVAIPLDAAQALVALGPEVSVPRARSRPAAKGRSDGPAPRDTRESGGSAAAMSLATAPRPS